MADQVQANAVEVDAPAESVVEKSRIVVRYPDGGTKTVVVPDGATIEIATNTSANTTAMAGNTTTTAG